MNAVAVAQSAEYQELLAQGLTTREIAERRGLSVSAVKNRLSDPDGAKQRARRERYRGRCKECGVATDGSGGRSQAPEFCVRHIWLKPGFREAHTKWPRPQILDAIHEWNREYGEPPAVTDWNPTQARAMGRPDRVERFLDGFAVGRWPWFATVIYHFGSWNAAIEAAGFKSRQANGGGGNVLRSPRVSRAHLRREAIQQLCDRGFRLSEIAHIVWRDWGYSSQASCYSVFHKAGVKEPRQRLTDDELTALLSLDVDA